MYALLGVSRRISDICYNSRLLAMRWFLQLVMLCNVKTSDANEVRKNVKERKGRGTNQRSENNKQYNGRLVLLYVRI